jgi:Tfp pilus assembly protein PilV
MKRLTQNRNKNSVNATRRLVKRTARRGTTLTEVLASVMIMSIGVISIASLFPVALLRSIRATQVTHSTNLRLNAESMLEVHPHLKNGAYPWSVAAEAAVFGVGSVVTSDPANGRFYQCTSAATGITANFRAQFSSNDAVGTPVDHSPAGGAIWVCIGAPHSGFPATQNFIVDPMGYAQKLVTATAIVRSFGNTNESTPTYDLTNGQYFSPIRLTGDFNSVRLADSVVTLPDNWTEQARDTPAAKSPTSVTIEADLSGLEIYEDVNQNGLLDAGEDTNGNGALDTGVSRAVLYDITKRTSQVRLITSASAAGVVTWADPLPAGFVVSDVRIETQQPQFSWLLSVRRGDGNLPEALHTDLVTFFRRESNNPDDEHVYECSFLFVGVDGAPGVAGFDDDGNGTDDDISELGAINSDDYFTCQVNWDEAGGEPVPSIKKGGFVFDAENCRWYRIQRILSEGTGFAQLRLEERIGEQSSVILPGKTVVGVGMFLDGVVDVYPLGSKK